MLLLAHLYQGARAEFWILKPSWSWSRFEEGGTKRWFVYGKVRSGVSGEMRNGSIDVA